MSAGTAGPVRSLWVGPALSGLERLSIQSFLANGHSVELYCYESPEGIPEGTIIRDAAEVLPESMVFRYRDCGALSGFANQFRYEMLLLKGGWWVDLDIVCLQPLPELRRCAVASEFQVEDPIHPTNAAMFAPPNDPFIQELCAAVRARDPEHIVWCETGPTLLGEALSGGTQACDVLPVEAFCPVPAIRWFDTFLPGRVPQFGEQTYGVHFWHEMWRRAQLDKDETYGRNSLFEVLKARYGVVSRQTAQADGER